MTTAQMLMFVAAWCGQPFGQLTIYNVKECRHELLACADKAKTGGDQFAPDKLVECAKTNSKVTQ